MSKTMGDVLGHGEIIRVLRNSVAGERVAHAYLFAGAPGVGKKTTAFAFARALLCRSPRDGDACGTCPDCIRTGEDEHPDLHVVSPEGKSFKIDQVREIQKETGLRPFGGRRHVYVLIRADAMTREAANCLLKTLEEPPPGTVLVLVTDRPFALPPTVLSRCQQFYFKPLSLQEVCRGIRESGYTGDDVEMYAALSGGSIGRARFLISGGDGRRELLAKIGSLETGRVSDVIALSEELAELEDPVAAMDVLLFWMRDILVWKETARKDMLFNRDLTDEIRRLAPSYSRWHLREAIAAVERAKTLLSAGVNKRLIWENVLFQAVLPQRGGGSFALRRRRAF